MSDFSKMLKCPKCGQKFMVTGTKKVVKCPNPRCGGYVKAGENK